AAFAHRWLDQLLSPLRSAGRCALRSSEPRARYDQAQADHGPAAGPALRHYGLCPRHEPFLLPFPNVPGEERQAPAPDLQQGRPGACMDRSHGMLVTEEED